MNDTPSGGGGFGFFSLVFLAVVAYVAYRAVQARRSGEDVGKAAGRALMEAAPPAIAAGIGMIFLMLAAVMMLFLFVPLLFFMIFATFVSAFGGNPDIGPFGELATPIITFMLIGIVLLVGAMAWLFVMAFRRLRSPRAPRPHAVVDAASAPIPAAPIPVPGVAPAVAEPAPAQPPTRRPRPLRARAEGEEISTADRRH